ncbi:MAG: GntR family transcriptional regulator, partial [Pseudomonadota bacterium]
MKPASRQVADTIRTLILRGDFPAGEHLREAALADRFQVSRTPVRAALAENAKDGLLDYEPNRGYRVRRFDLRDIADAFELRAVLEGTACRVAAERGLDLEAERSAR